MDIHEYQAKEILASFGVTIPRGGIVYSPETAENKAREIGGSKWVVKAQIHSGARGKAGGVIVCNSPLEVAQATDKLLGKKLVTNQTGPQGKIVNRIYIEEATDIEKELYLGLVFDRSSESIMIVASTEGGMSVEEIAKEKPDSIIRSKIEVAVGIQDFQARELAFGLGIEPELVRRVSETIIGCAKAFSELDATMVEVNPLVISKQKQILALDCKMSFDNNAMFRRDKVSELRDKTQEDEKEVYASDRGLNYVSLDGNIGNIINGAGLAMASMDMIKLAGGEPANFLDVGGGATPEKIVKAFRLITMDKKVKVILVNIFAGINRCDWVAEGIVTWLWGGYSVDNPTLTRFFTLHYLIPFLILGLVVLHIWALHIPGNNNPVGIDIKKPSKDTVPFHPYIVIKDGFALLMFMIVFAFFVFYTPNILGHADNYIEANPLVTPAHIVPEWYLLPFYAILRSVPDKLLGVIAMLSAILILAALPWLDTSKIRSAVFRPLYKQFYWILVADVLILGYVGAMPAEGLYLLIARIATAYYFLHFLVVLPILGFKERTTPVPLSITEPILGGSPNLATVKKKDNLKDQ